MRQLTDTGRYALEGIAQRNGVSFDAVTTLLAALDRGGGSQAQFSHYELGGMGQWSQGGMIMVGDMFNNGLKYRVDQLCNEISNLMRSQDLFVPTPAYGALGGSGGWWPPECGYPSSSGGQNDMQYAVFPATHRLAIRIGDQVRVYDTGQHQIGGFSQQQGDNVQDLTFSSQFGTVRLHDLPLVSGAMPPQQQAAPSFSAPVYSPTPVAAYEQRPAYQPAPAYEPSVVKSEPMFQPTPVSAEPQFAPQPASSGSVSEDDIFAKIERLHGLQTKGIISEEEFAAKKKDLLDRL